MTRVGMKGFDEAGMAVGEVYGVRWWAMPSEKVYPVLRGAYSGEWRPGDNVAACVNRSHPVPDEDCGCGFWGYWLTGDTPPVNGQRVLGVIKGWGDDTLIGEKGFRCAVARIVALSIEKVIQRRVSESPPVYVPGPPPGVHFSRGPGAMDTFRAFGGRGTWQEDKNAPPKMEADYLAQAELEYRLGETFGVPVYTTPEAMLTMHPTTKDYLPPSALPPPPPWLEELTRARPWNSPEEYQAAVKQLTAMMTEAGPDPLMPQTTSGADALRKLVDRADLTDESYPIDDMARWGTHKLGAG